MGRKINSSTLYISSLKCYKIWIVGLHWIEDNIMPGKNVDGNADDKK